MKVIELLEKYKILPRRCYWCGMRFHNLPLTFRKIWCDKLKQNGISNLETEIELAKSHLIVNYPESHKRILNNTWSMKLNKKVRKR